MPKPLFDRKFGAEFIKTVPLSPGVYEMLDETGAVLYVGKARRLRRRLQQYRNSRRCKKHRKMREILRAARSLRIRPCATDLEALLLENELIQKFRPRFNVSGAFSFLYPCVGLQREGSTLILCCTTSPDEFPMFQFYGAFRSRDTTREAFAALLDVLDFIGHREPHKTLAGYPKIRFSSLAGFRQIDTRWVSLLEAFLRGDSREFLETAVLALIEKPYARRHREQTQALFDSLARFFSFEAAPLRVAMRAAGLTGAGISQGERDRLFLKSRHAKSGTSIELKASMDASRSS